MITMLDDGEKFGVWPNTHKMVYEEGWLERFFKSLEANRDWLEMRLCSEFMEEVPPRRLTHMPNNSYFELGVWSLPSKTAGELEHLAKELEARGEKYKYQLFLRGGFWRGFLSKYPEANMMQKWMLNISREIADFSEKDKETSKTLLTETYKHLLKGQCNCPYWHGVFGGLYLPHLRHAVFSELVDAQAGLDKLKHNSEDFIDHKVMDIDCDGADEILIDNKELSLILKPSFGGSITLLAYKDKGYNLLNTLTRRYEYYHDEILGSDAAPAEDGISIHNLKRVVSKEIKDGLVYDWYNRYSLLDHFFGEGVNEKNLISMKFSELGDFVNQPYTYKSNSLKDKVTLSLTRDGHIHYEGNWVPVRISKDISINNKNSEVKVSYRFLNRWDKPVNVHPGVEWNFFFLGGNDTEKSFKFDEKKQISPLDVKLGVEKVNRLEITDRRLNFMVTLEWNETDDCFIVPVKTVSQSESGYELIYQGSSIIPHWRFKLDPDEEKPIDFIFKIKST
jgi:alpha-amylase